MFKFVGKTWLIPFLAMLLVASFAAAVVLSNTLSFGGVLAANPLEASYTNGDPGPTTLNSGVAETFNITVANTDNVLQDFMLNMSFTPSFVVTSVTGTLTLIELIDGIYVPSVETLTWNYVVATWFAESILHSIDAFAADWYELSLTVTFAGSGSWTLDVFAEV